MNKSLISYAGEFSSFLIKNLPPINNIKNIILFGSVARGEASRESDVDIFIELLHPDKTFQQECDKLKKKFFESIKFRQYWLLLGIENEFNIISGTFEEWEELKNSIIADGILLYGKFSAMPEGRDVMIAFWKEIKPNSKRVLFNKKIFGYKQNKKSYPGLLQKYAGQKIGKGAILLTMDAQKELREIIKRLHIKTRMIRMREYE